MPATFPPTPRAPTATRLAAIAIALAALALAARTTFTSVGWVGQVFPGFLVLNNRVIASVDGPWPGSTIPGLYQSEILAVDGRPVGSTAEIYRLVAARPPGTPVRYLLRRFGQERELVVETQRFTARDWLFFVPFFLNGVAWLGAGLVVWVLSPGNPLPRALLAWCTCMALFVLTVPDLYGPATFFRLHIVGEALLPAAGLHLALLFPQRSSFAGWRFAPYLLSLAILIPYQLFLYHQPVYTVLLFVNMTYLGLAALLFGVRQIFVYFRSTSQLARQRVRVITLGAVFGFGYPAVVLLASVFTGGGLAMNQAALTPPLFALSIAYALVKHDLFEIDAMVKRGAYYLVLTGAVGAAYIGAVLVFNFVLRAGAVTESPAFPVVFTLAVLALFNPLRNRVQAIVDRVFYRTTYDGAQLLATVGEKLTSTLQRDRILALVRGCIEDAIPNAGTRLFVEEEHTLVEAGGMRRVPAAVARRLADGRLVTAFDPVEVYPDAATHDAVRGAMTEIEAEVAVPLQLNGGLLGALTAGRKRSGLFYTAVDAQFLRALANQVAIALGNARSYEAVAALNAELEERVRQRTAELETAYSELKTAETHLVHSEKMASLGRLVSGVAHEINNPVSFIASSVAPLRERLAQAAAEGSPAVTTLVQEADEIAGIIARGAERTAAIVKDLRTFSRLGEATRKASDLQEGLEMSLRLLAPRWGGRITVHRDYQPLPPVECDAAQLNQVFMNVLANACDAIGERGNIWVATRAEGDTVTVTIRDDGRGIPPETVGHIFDPFFTTKDVGAGTGLGLAISHGIVSAHGGRIEVESAPGAGATFRIVLPTGAPALSLDRAAGGKH